jgi:hypothetical protein
MAINGMRSVFSGANVDVDGMIDDLCCCNNVDKL